MTEISALQVVVGYDDSAVAAGVGRTSSTVEGLGSKIQTALGAAAVGAVAGLGAAFVGSISSAANFEKEISAIGAVSGATASQMDGIRATALQLGKDTSFSASEAAAGMEEIIKAGVPLEAAMGGAARAVLDLAAAGGTEVPKAAQIMSNAMNTFSLSGADAAHIADLIAGAANASAIDVNDFGFSLSSVGAVAHTIGLSLEDTTTAIAALGQAGLKGSDAGTSLKTMLLNLSPSTKKATEEMRALGIITADGSNRFFDAQGKVKSLADISAVLQTAMKGLTKEEQINALQTAFGTDAIRAAAIMANLGAAGMNEMADAVKKQGDAQAIANERLNNVRGSWEKFTGSVETGAIMLGSLFLPALKQVIDGLTDFANEAIDAIGQIPDAIETVRQVIAGDWAPADSIQPFTNAVGNAAVMIRDNFGPAIQAVAGFITGTLIPGIQRFAGPIAAFVGGFLATVGAVGAASAVISGIVAVLGLLLSPLGAVAIAVGLLAAAWATNFGNIQGIVAQFVAIVQQALSGDIQGAFTAFVALLATTTTAIVEQLKLWAQAFVDWIAPMIPPFLAAVTAFGLQFLAWIAAQIPLIVAQLLLWAQAFIDWVAPFIPPLLAALGAMATALLGWIAAQIPLIAAQLLLWGQEFVAWVAPQIPPLIAAATALGAALVAWIAAEIPVLTAQLLLWGQEFVAWVAPAIPPMQAALATLGAALMAWLAQQIPLIAAQLALWGKEFTTWVGPASIGMAGALGEMAGSIVRWLVETQLQILAGVTAWATEFGKIGTLAAPELAKGLATLFVQIETFFLALPVKMVEWGVSAIEAFIKGFLSKAIPMPALPSFGGGGGGAQTQSFATGPGGTHVSAYMDLINKVAAQMGEDPALVAAIMDTEGSGAGSTSPAGARGLMQVMPNYVAPGENPFDPETSIREGIRAIQEKRRAVGNDPADIAGAYFGYGTDAGGMTTGGYRQRFTQNYNQYRNQPAAPPSGTPGVMDKTMSSWAPGASPGDWPGFMQQVNEQLPDYLTSLDTIQQAGTAAFTGTAQAATTEGQAMVSASTDSLGNVTRIYTENGIAIGATITNAAGVVVNSFGSMGTGAVAAAGAMAVGVTGQAAAMATGVTEQTNLMSSGALTSVTNLGTGMLTTVQTSAGTTIATVTDMAGQVTSQYATLANGAQLSMDGLAAGVLVSTTDLGTGMLTIVQDTAGNYIATTTDLAGNVTGQYTQLAADVIDQTQQQSDGVQQTTADMADAVLTSVTDMGDGVITITTDASGQMIGTVTDMAGNVTSTYSSMGSDVQGTVEDMAGAVVEQFGDVASAASDTLNPLDDFKSAIEDVPSPDFGDIVGGLNDIEDAAKDAAKELDKVIKGVGKVGGVKNEKDSPFAKHKATGGPVDIGETYLVGEHGPELFTAGASGTITPNHMLAGLGGGGSVQHHVVDFRVDGNLAERIYIRGRDITIQRTGSA
jgi:TP901 family phage tail tape measure protein